MITWHRTTSLTPQERRGVLALLNDLEDETGREAIDEGRRRVILHGGVGDHWLGLREGRLHAYAQGSAGAAYTVEQAGGGVDEDLLRLLLAECETVDFWVRGAQDVPAGGRSIRVLQMLAVELPVPVTPLPEGARLRPFVIGQDEDAWLTQNNRAFAHHPEQGAWKREDLDARLREQWFDPSGFLLLEIDGVLAASCWTKIHELHRDRAGEIYVISVSPDFQRRGLGRIMVTQGLASLRQRGVANALLFVERTNVEALSLYHDLGFRLVREDGVLRYQR